MIVTSVVGFTNDINTIFELKVILVGLLSSALLLGSYPMTQIYQHEEDTKRGDKTIRNQRDFFIYFEYFWNSGRRIFYFFYVFFWC